MNGFAPTVVGIIVAGRGTEVSGIAEVRVTPILITGPPPCCVGLAKAFQPGRGDPARGRHSRAAPGFVTHTGRDRPTTVIEPHAFPAVRSLPDALGLGVEVDRCRGDVAA
jgi:hypothetical protein